MFWVIAVAALALDQVTKLVLWSPPEKGRAPIVLIPRLLQLVAHEGNSRGLLGLGPASPVVWVTFSVVGLLIIWLFLTTTLPQKILMHVALGMLAGGAVGNLIDRLIKGRVRDFIDLHWGDAIHWHTFNVADAAICAGLALVLFDAFFGKEMAPRPPGARSSPRAQE